MTFYTDLASEALELITEFGASITLTRKTVGTYDPSTGAASETSADYPGVGVLIDYSQREIDGTSVRAGDQRCWIATDGMVLPRTGDTLTIGSTVYSVVTGGHVAPAGTAAVYWAQLRGVA